MLPSLARRVLALASYRRMQTDGLMWDGYNISDFCIDYSQLLALPWHLRRETSLERGDGASHS